VPLTGAFGVAGGHHDALRFERMNVALAFHDEHALAGPHGL